MAAKGKIESGERSNRVRFVMLEADLSDANVNVLANAIVSALRPDVGPAPKRLAAPAPPVVTRLGTPVSAPTNGQNGDGDAQPEQDVETPDEPPVQEAAPAATTRPPRKPSKPPVPDYVELFANANEADSFKQFVAQHPTKKDSERYLVCALYLRDHGHPTINMDKVYSCYRIVGGDWSMTINDWDVNLRNQVRNDRFRRADGGGYTLTTKGEGVVQKLRK